MENDGIYSLGAPPTRMDTSPGQQLLRGVGRAELVRLCAAHVPAAALAAAAETAAADSVLARRFVACS